MEELNRLGDPVLDQHTLGIARHQRRATGLEVVGQQDGRLLVSQIDDRDLTQRAVIILQMDSFVQDSGGTEGPGQRGQSDPLPGRCRTAEDLAQYAPGPATECQETNTSPVQSVQVGVGGQLQIEHQLGRVLSDLLAPELDESQDFVGLFELGNSGVSVATRWPASRAKNVRMPFWLRLRREM